MKLLFQVYLRAEVGLILQSYLSIPCCTALPFTLHCRTCNKRFLLIWVHLLSCLHNQEITHREYDKTGPSLDTTFSMFNYSVSYFFLKHWNNFYVQCPLSPDAPCSTKTPKRCLCIYFSALEKSAYSKKHFENILVAITSHHSPPTIYWDWMFVSSEPPRCL